MNARWFGFNPPFFGGPEGVMSRQEDEKLIKNDLLQLLLTSPGERAYRPGFGTSLRRTVFEPNDESTITQLEQEIQTAIQNEEPRVYLETLTLTRVPNRNQLNIYLSVRLKSDPTQVINIERTLEIEQTT